MKSPDLHAWLTLCNIPGLGPTAISALISHIGSPEQVLSASFQALCAVPGIGPTAARAIRSRRDDARATAQIRRAEALGVSIMTFEDAAYPENLKLIHAPPPILFVKGHLEKLTSRAIAIVGSRAITAYGRDIARRLARELVRNDIAVISGMAVGIDAHAHQAALEAGGFTGAVLGSGLDKPYPPQNLRLFHDIGRQGVVLSEFPMGTGPEAHNFPRRNRIISGLSLGTVVVEAGERSGALITAQYALEQNRDVFAVPGPVFSGKSLGTNRLIQQGAMLIHDVCDILGELALHLRSTPQEATAPHLEGDVRTVWEALSADAPTHIDDIARTAALPGARVLECLLELELQSHIEQLPGMQFRRQK